jgi:hypothetical protein
VIPADPKAADEAEKAVRRLAAQVDERKHPRTNKREGARQRWRISDPDGEVALTAVLPVVVDAGAAAGSLVWLGGQVVRAARTFARALALTLLALSVAANALGHGPAAFGLAPAWWVVVIVSAVAPAVLGAVVHLAVLVGRPQPVVEPESDEEPIPYELTAAANESGTLDEQVCPGCGR